MTLVIDTSLIAAWIFKEIETPAIEEIAGQLALGGASVPQLFPLEMANVLNVAVRKRRLSADETSKHLAFVSQLPLRVDDDTASRAWNETYRLARSEDMTVYDAAYLELALRLGAELATLDTALAGAARRRGLIVLP